MSKYSELSPELLQNHLDGFLIEHWSISAVQEFIRNEKSFEKSYIYKDYSRAQSPTAIAGKVYHDVLKSFFERYKDGKVMGFDEMTMLAHAYLDLIGADEYRPQKSKTIEEQQQGVLKSVNNGIKNFLAEFDSYSEEIQEILFIEETFKEFITINEIEIPLPLKVKVDVVFINKEGFLSVFDHKLKANYTDASEVDLRYSSQSIGYCLCIGEAIKKFPDILKRWPKAKEGVKRFYYYENKCTQNRDGSRQIKQISINLDESRVLYEQMLFEGVFRLMEAVQNPDHVYLINPNDFFVSAEEIMEFWIKTHVEGLEGFPNLTPQQKTILQRKRKDIRRSALTGLSKSIIKAFTKPKDFISMTPEDMTNLTTEEKIEHRLRTFNYPVRVEHKVEGYSCDTYLVQVGGGLKTSTIFSYRMDIANAIGMKDVRIAPSLVSYKGGAHVAIEVNKANRTPLYLVDNEIPPGFEFPIGKNNYGETISWDIGNPSTPHLMIAGGSGSGKSVAVKTIIEVAKKKGVRVTILDPKREFEEYQDKGYEVINDQKDIEDFMEYTVMEMDEIFKKHGARGNSENKRLIIFDEAADCFARQSKKRVAFTEGPKGGERKHVDHEFKTLEQNTLILAQKARSAGIHLVLAAQRFSVKVMTGDAKANFSTRLCLTVASGVDSKVMIDQDGAEKLNGKGDALFTSPEHSEPVRIQCFTTQ